MYKLIILTLIFSFKSSTLLAYIGPGMGGGFIAATIGIIVAIFAAIFGLLWFPIKRIIKKRKKTKEQKKID